MNPADLEWQNDAACKGSSVDFFPNFSTKTTVNTLTKIATVYSDALELCDSCPVQRECRRHYLENFPIWSQIAGGVFFHKGRGRERVIRLPRVEKDVTKDPGVNVY